MKATVVTAMCRLVSNASRRILSEQDALAIQEGMVAVMKEGTGRRIQLDGWSSAGKTGTTQNSSPSTVVCNIPINITSVLLCVGLRRVQISSQSFLALVTVDEPTKGGYYGGSTAGRW